MVELRQRSGEDGTTLRNEDEHLQDRKIYIVILSCEQRGKMRDKDSARFTNGFFVGNVYFIYLRISSVIEIFIANRCYRQKFPLISEI